jgi:hypothetical protein
MNENIQFEYVTKDGKHHKINTPATTIFQAAHELLEGIAIGDIKVDPRNIVQITDIPG